MAEYLDCCFDANLSKESLHWNLLGRLIQSYNAYIEKMGF